MSINIGATDTSYKNRIIDLNDCFGSYMDSRPIGFMYTLVIYKSTIINSSISLLSQSSSTIICSCNFIFIKSTVGKRSIFRSR